MDAVAERQTELKTMQEKLTRMAQRIREEKGKESELMTDLGDAIFEENNKKEKAIQEKIDTQRSLIETLRLSLQATEEKTLAIREAVAEAERERAEARQVLLKSEYETVMIEYTNHLWEMWQLAQRIDSLYREDAGYVRRFALPPVAPIKSTSIGNSSAEVVAHVCMALIEKKMPDIFKQSGAFDTWQRRTIRKHLSAVRTDS